MIECISPRWLFAALVFGAACREPSTPPPSPVVIISASREESGEVASPAPPFDWANIDRNQSLAEGLVGGARRLVVLSYPPRVIFDGSLMARPLSVEGCDGVGAVFDALDGTYAECHRDGASSFVRLDRPNSPPIALPPSLATVRPGSRARPRSLVIAGAARAIVIFDGTFVHRGDHGSWRSVAVGPLPSPVVRARLDPTRSVVASGRLYMLYDLPEGSTLVAVELESGAVSDLTSASAGGPVEALGVDPDGHLWVARRSETVGASFFAELHGDDVTPNSHLPEIAGPVAALEFASSGELIALSATKGLFRIRTGAATPLTPSWPADLRGTGLRLVDGFAWVATRDAGLLRIELERGRTDHVALPVLP